MKNKILTNKTYLGIELGSTRIKACLIDDTFSPIAGGGYEWENKYENGFWTYSLEDIHKGVKECFKSLSEDVENKYGIALSAVGAIGISAMMHGYLAFDKYDNLLAPFRTWRNVTTEQASTELTKLFNFNIPQRWSISHLYQAILNGEEHISKIAHITTLSGYIHYLLTGKWELGVGDASGMFPLENGQYNREMIEKFNVLAKSKGFNQDLSLILPQIKAAGDCGAVLTQNGAEFLDPTGTFQAGILLCPPEGDAGTGMVATNSVSPKTGNISAGTSIFAMLVLENPLSSLYPQIDIVTTPSGADVAMVHCNNCSAELDAWVNIFGEFASLSGNPIGKSTLYELLYSNTLNGDDDCGKVMAYNYLSGEHVTHIQNGRPMYFRLPDGKMNLANFMKSQLYSSVATLSLGMKSLFESEKVAAEKFTAHGGLFKVKGVAQQILSNALNTSVSVMKTAGEGGAWGMALLASYMINKDNYSLGEWLSYKVFAGMETTTLTPNENGVKGFNEYLSRYNSGLSAQKSAENV